MRIGLLALYVASALGGRYAVAQDLTGHAVLGAACIDVNQTALNYIAVGRLKDAQATSFRGPFRPDKRLRATVWLADTAQPGNRHGLIGADRGSRVP